MKSYNMHEAKTHLSRIVDQVADGETVLIGKAGKPIAVLSPYNALQTARTPGGMAGKIEIADDFDEVDAEITSLFEDEHA